LDPEDIRKPSIGAIWTFGKGTGPFNPLNDELNPICRLLALLRAHHILHVSRIKVNLVVDHGAQRACFKA
jgi:hypothetical protein